MAPALYTLLALPLALTGTLGLGVVDDAGTRTVTIGVPATTVYLRVLLAEAGVPATLAQPAELLSSVAAALGTGWSLTLGADGRVTVAYSGTVGTLDLSAAPWLYHALGFDSWAGALDCTGAGQTAPWSPLGCLLLASREEDRGWQPQPGQQAHAQREDGVVYGYHASNYLLTRTVRAALLPRDPDTAQRLGATSTPLLPRDTARWRQVPALAPATYAPPYSLHEWLTHARGLAVACAWGTLPAHLAETEQAYEEAYLTPDSIAARDAVAPRIAAVEQFYSRDKLALSYYQSRSRHGLLLLESGGSLLLEDGSRLLLG